MKLPVSPVRLGIFVFAIAFLFAFVQFGVVSIAFDKLGLTQQQAISLLIVSLAGSVINIPLFRLQSEAEARAEIAPAPFGMLKPFLPPFEGYTTIAINVGGCVVPVLFSIYLMYLHPMAWLPLIAAIVFVTLVSRFASTPIAGIGIGMPVLVAPLAAASTGILLGGDASAPMAYIAGTLGVLIGADILRIRDILRLAVPIASIGGAGTFDGIYITGLVAVLLA